MQESVTIKLSSRLGHLAPGNCLTRHAIAVSWKGSSVNGYCFARGPLWWGSCRVPACRHNIQALHQVQLQHWCMPTRHDGWVQ